MRQERVAQGETLGEYDRKRNFRRTPEPKGEGTGDRGRSSPGLRFVVQMHAARRLHYDVRLELDGTLKSWAVPKGPSLDPAVRALAVHVEDHPLEYRFFEGVIPKGEYGGGTMMLWDQGEWTPIGDPREGYRKGRLRFRLEGERLRGEWSLVRMGGEAGDGGKNWLLRKSDDQEAGDRDVTDLHTTSVATGRTMEEIASGEEAASSPPPLPAPPDGAPQGALPAIPSPQLPTLVDHAPEGDDWLHELKYDGYRILARLDNDEPALITRGGHDWSDRFPGVTRAVRALGLDGTILDGEVAVPAPDGTTDFQALQNRMTRGHATEVAYFVFDLPYYRGRDLRRTPIEERKRILRRILERARDDRVLRYSDHIEGQGARVAEHACLHSLEGIVAKRKGSGYRPGRTRDWVKVKCLDRQEFVIGGWTEPSGSRTGFGALLLGWYDGGRLVYSGRVGTGFDAATLQEIRGRLEDLERSRSPFDPPPTGAAARGVHWVEPTLVAEVRFTGWTGEGRLRHPAFLGLRSDKPPEEVTRDMPKPAPDPTKHQAEPGRVAGVRLTNADRVLYPEQGVTKGGLAIYYETVASWILPHLEGRPLSLVRCPRGHEEKCFYQKHLTEGLPEPVRGIAIEESDASKLYVALDDLAGLVTLVQFGVLELHPWGSREDRLDRPDRIVIDLDPGPGVEWPAILEAARYLRHFLGDLGLESWVRTTGGKGLHVVAPIARRSEWDEVKAFARNVALHMERRDPAAFVSTSSKAKRKGRIYVDYLRNGRGATAIASYSTRARPGAPVATPLRWDELDGLGRPDEYTVANVPSRLASLGGDPWEGFFESRQVLTRRMKEAVAAD